MKKYFRFFLVYLFSLLMLFSLVSCSNEENNHQDLSDEDIINLVIDNFMPLTKVPRPSHFEEMISQYLMDFATYNGLEPKRDKFNNVMFDVPATKGMEDR